MPLLWGGPRRATGGFTHEKLLPKAPPEGLGVNPLLSIPQKSRPCRGPGTPLTVITQPAVFAVFGWTLALIDGAQPFVDVPAVQYGCGP